MIISGPCSAETENQVLETARRLKESAKLICFVPGSGNPEPNRACLRASGEPALSWLSAAKVETGLPITVEVANARHVDMALKGGLMSFGSVQEQR